MQYNTTLIFVLLCSFILHKQTECWHDDTQLIILIMNGNCMSNLQPTKIPCSTTAAVFLMTNDGIQTYRDIVRSHVVTPELKLQNQWSEHPFKAWKTGLTGTQLETLCQLGSERNLLWFSRPSKLHLLKCLQGTETV